MLIYDIPSSNFIKNSVKSTFKTNHITLNKTTYTGDRISVLFFVNVLKPGIVLFINRVCSEIDTVARTASS